MGDERRPVRRGGILVGLVLIAIGVALFLRAVGAVPATFRVWPILLLAAGLVMLVVRTTGWWGHYGGFVVPLVLIAIGGMVALRDAGAIDPAVSVWPAVLIGVGLGVLLEGVAGRPGPGPTTTVSVPLDRGTRSARAEIRHYGGRLRVAAGAGDGMLMEGTLAGDVTPEVRHGDDRMEVSLRPDRAWQQGPAEWDLGLSGEVPLTLELRTGAGETALDLSALLVEELSVRTGASKTDVVLPSRGRCRARVVAGAAGVVMTVPQGTAARIRSRTMGSVEVDEGRFPSEPGGWASPGFDAADDRVEIDLEGGAAGFTVR